MLKLFIILYSLIKFPQWYTIELKRHILLKKALHKSWKITNDIKTFIEFKKIRAQCIRLTRYAYQQQQVHIQSLAKSNLKQFWKYVNSKRKDNSIPHTMTFDNDTASDPACIADLFSKHFKAVYKPSSIFSDPSKYNNNYSYNSVHGSSMTSELDISHNEIYLAIKKLKTAYYLPSDGIPSIFIKKCSRALIHPLKFIFTRSYSRIFVSSLLSTQYSNMGINPLHLTTDQSVFSVR